MELDEMIKKALDLFLANPYWKEYYDNAPSEACREHIELDFVYSTFFGPDSIDELNEAIEEQFTLEDWKYLYKYAGNNPFKSTCRAKIKELGGSI